MNEQDLKDTEFSVSELRQRRQETGSDDPDSNSGPGRAQPGSSQGSWQRRRAPWEEDEPGRPAGVFVDGPPPRKQIGYAGPAEEPAPQAKKLPFDPFRILDALKNKWPWWLSAGLVLGLTGFIYGRTSTGSSLPVQLLRREMPVLQSVDKNDPFKPQQYSDQTFVNMTKAPEVLTRVAAQSKVPISPGKLSYSIVVGWDQGSELITLTFNTTLPPKEAADLMNLYVATLIDYSKEIQVRDAKDLESFYEEKLAIVSTNLDKANEEMNKFSPDDRVINIPKQMESYILERTQIEAKLETYKLDAATIDFKINALRRDMAVRNPASEKLQAAREQLDALLATKTELHPEVLAQKAKVEALEKQAATAAAVTNAAPSRMVGSTTADATYRNILDLEAAKNAFGTQTEMTQRMLDNIDKKLKGLQGSSMNFALLQSRYQTLEAMRQTIEGHLSAARLLEQKSLGFFKLFSPISADRVAKKNPMKKSLIFALAGALFGIFSVGGFVVVREVFDNKIRSVGDLQNATGLPVLATLGDLNKMSPAEQAQWAFRTWTILKGKLSQNQTEGLVCGFISAHAGEGRSTWINLLVNTANQRGLKVLTIATRPSDEPAVHPHEANSHEPGSEMAMTRTMSPNVLAFPAEVDQQLCDPNAQPVVHIPLPGWVWNLERRTQWQTALDHWKDLDNLVLLVELPPAALPESVLLAEKLPQIIWLADSGKATIEETREHLETLRHAKCNIVGSVLNHAPRSFWRKQMSRWMNLALIGLGLSASLATQAQDTAAPATNASPSTNFTIAVASSYRAPWQQRFTLGAGDVLNVGFFGETNVVKTELTVGPDGKVNYLQARDVQAAGKTVDELRAALDEALGKYYRNPRTILTPVAYYSKKYFVLGKVMKKGVFTLDRPITVIEALARASGFETGLLDRNTVDLADLQHSFLVRQGQRIPLNFEKLFLQGDLSQNIPIEPNDYLYFPPASLKELYVVGEVRTPGVVQYTSDSSVLAALTARGGFTDRAYKGRVLVVRGSLDHPESHVVDVLATLDGRAVDFKLEPRDIIYVSSRPFIKAEELLDIAATAFIQSAVSAWTGFNIGPIIKSPFFPRLNND